MRLDAATVVIATNRVPPYRIPIYSKFAAVCDTLEVVHHGEQRNTSGFLQQVYQKRSLLTKFTISKLGNTSSRADLMIIMFDLSYVSYLSLIIQRYVQRKPTLLWGHGYGQSRVGNRLRNLMIRLTSGLIVYNDKAKRLIQNSGISEEKLFVAHNSMEVVDPARSSTNKNAFIYVGRIQSRKQLSTLIDAFAQLLKSVDEGERFELIVLGDGAGKQELIAQCVELGITAYTKFLDGTYDASALKEVYDTALAYVSPGHVGLGVLQSFGHGVPVVTFDVDGHAPESADIVTEYNGLLVPPTSQALTEAMLRLATNSEFANTLGENALATYKKFDVAQMVNSLAAASSQALSKYR